MTTKTSVDPTAMLTVRIAGDVSVCVPNDVQLMTPYVLLEQEDWFEDDIRFVRRFVQPGDVVVDIGANYGVYTLSMAKTVGEAGHVWAIDPSAATMTHLEQSLKKNGFANVDLIHAGLSDAIGAAYLSREDNPELGAVSSDAVAGRECDEISLLTLDECAQRFGWRDIRFIKMDAEGYEAKILRGGTHFLTTQSPLIMYEIKAGNELNRSLIGAFEALGYSSYRLLPMPSGEMLVPLEGADEDFDPFILNLYCCKPDRAAELNSRGILCRAIPYERPVLSGELHGMSILASEPHAGVFDRLWREYVFQRDVQFDRDAYLNVLNQYVQSKSADVDVCQRAAHLKAAFDQLRDLVLNEATLGRLLSLVRIATEYGKRAVAVKVLQQLMAILERQALPLANEPFLAPPMNGSEIGDDPGLWQARAIAESYIRLGAYSDYFKGDGNQQLLDVLCKLGHVSPEMERRRQLIRMRSGLQRQPEASSLVRSFSGLNLNPDFWCGS